MLCCCAVGGIYTVIRTKAGRTFEEWGDQFVLIGPYNSSSVRTEVEVCQDDSIMPRAVREVLNAMRWNGVKVSICLSSLLFVSLRVPVLFQIPNVVPKSKLKQLQWLDWRGGAPRLLTA